MSGFVQRSGASYLEVAEDDSECRFPRVDQEMYMIRHDHVCEKQEIVGGADGAKIVQDQCPLGGRKRQHAFRQVSGDEEVAVGLLDAVQSGYNN